MSETPMKKQALLIGINKYEILPELKFARQDAEAVEQALKQNYSFSEDEVMLLTDAKPGLFKPMNKHIIQTHLENLANQELDLFIFGFWGHGLFRNGERYLCPLDVIGSAVEELGFSFSELQRLLSKIRAKNTCMILDCCQKVHDRGEEETLTAADQSAMENMARDIVLRRQQTEPEFVSNVAILNSCKEGQAAYEWDSRKHGIFTAHLLDALNRRYDSVAQIVGYVSKNVEKTAMELGKMQTPLCRLEGDITLPVDNHSKPTPPQPQQQSTSKSKGVKWNVAILALVALLGITTLYLLATGRGKSAPAYNKPKQSPKQMQKQVGYEYPQNQTKAIEPIQEVQKVFDDLPTIKAGERTVVTFKGVEFAFRWCPAGTCKMDLENYEASLFQAKDIISSMGEIDFKLPNGFWMMETEVTQKQWKAVMGTNPSHFKGDDLPVENVSWNDCQEFCKKTGLQLPTDVQWEYAWRSGISGIILVELDKMAWYDSNSGNETHPVGTKEPNAWGLYDMNGNVWEWCQYIPRGIILPNDPLSGSSRVVRGGSWRSSGWLFLGPNYDRSSDVGFRCVKGQVEGIL